MININRNILEIASQGVSLYDDFVTLSERLLQLGERLDDAKEDFDYTIKKLKTGNGSLIRKIETLKNLGIKTKKHYRENFWPERRTHLFNQMDFFISISQKFLLLMIQ